MQLLRNSKNILYRSNHINKFLLRFNSEKASFGPINTKDEEPRFLEMVKEYFDIAASKSGLCHLFNSY